MRDVVEVPLVGLDEVVQGAVFLLNPLLQLAPRRLDDLEQDVVLQLAHKVNHLGENSASRLPCLRHRRISVLEDAARSPSCTCAMYSGAQTQHALSSTGN